MRALTADQPDRKPGRSPYVAVRLPPDDLALVDAEAKRCGKTRSALVRELVTAALKPTEVAAS